jgi:hypothetical protein
MNGNSKNGKQRGCNHKHFADQAKRWHIHDLALTREACDDLLDARPDHEGRKVDGIYVKWEVETGIGHKGTN